MFNNNWSIKFTPINISISIRDEMFRDEMFHNPTHLEIEVFTPSPSEGDILKKIIPFKNSEAVNIIYGDDYYKDCYMTHSFMQADVLDRVGTVRMSFICDIGPTPITPIEIAKFRMATES